MGLAAEFNKQTRFRTWLTFLGSSQHKLQSHEQKPFQFSPAEQRINITMTNIIIFAVLCLSKAGESDAFNSSVSFLWLKRTWAFSARASCDKLRATAKTLVVNAINKIIGKVEKTKVLNIEKAFSWSSVANIRKMDWGIAKINNGAVHDAIKRMVTLFVVINVTCFSGFVTEMWRSTNMIQRLTFEEYWKKCLVIKKTSSHCLEWQMKLLTRIWGKYVIPTKMSATANEAIKQLGFVCSCGFFRIRYATSPFPATVRRVKRHPKIQNQRLLSILLSEDIYAVYGLFSAVNTNVWHFKLPLFVLIYRNNINSWMLTTFSLRLRLNTITCHS